MSELAWLLVWKYVSAKDISHFSQTSSENAKITKATIIKHVINEFGDSALILPKSLRFDENSVNSRNEYDVEIHSHKKETEPSFRFQKLSAQLYWLHLLECYTQYPEKGCVKGALNLEGTRWEYEEKFKYKYQLIMIDSLPALEKAFQNGMIPTTRMANLAQSIPVLELLEKAGILPNGSGLVRAFHTDNYSLINWMQTRGIVPVSALMFINQKMSSSLKQYARTTSKINPGFLQYLYSLTIMEGNYQLLKELYEIHREKPIYFHRAVKQYPLSVINWVLQEKIETESSLFESALHCDRFDVLDFLCSLPWKIPERYFHWIVQHGSIELLEWGMNRFGLTLPKDLMLTSLHSGKVEKVQFLLDHGYLLPEKPVELLITTRTGSIPLFDFLGKKGLWPARAFVQDYLQSIILHDRIHGSNAINNDRVSQWIQKHYWFTFLPF